MLRKLLSYELREEFLESLAMTGSPCVSAAQLGVSVRKAYALREREKDFAKLWDEALEIALDDLESQLLQRAKTGVTQPHIVRGKEVGMITTYSDALAMFMLKAKRPQTYGSPKDVKTASKDDGKKLSLPVKELEAKLAAMEARVKDAK